MFGSKSVLKFIVNGLAAAMTASLMLATGCAPGERDPASENDALAKCDVFFNQTGYCANVIWEAPAPSDSSEGTLTLEFYKQDAPTVLVAPPATVSVTPWMPSMNHGSPHPVQIDSMSGGLQTRVSRIALPMSGHWEIHIQLSNGSQLVDEAILKYNRL